MKRFDKQPRDDRKRPPSFRPRERSFSGRGEGFEDRPAPGGRRGFEGGKDRPQRRFEGRERSFDGPQQRFGGGRSDSRPQHDDRRGNTFRREGGPSGGYGRPNFERRESRYDAPRQDAPRQTSSAPREMPARASAPVPLARLKGGVRDANRALAEVVEQFGHTLEGGYDISALEVTVSFGDDGRFLGFGKGGAATMTLSITPVDSESLLEADEDSDLELDEEALSANSDEAEFDDEDSVDESAIMSDDDTDASQRPSSGHAQAGSSHANATGGSDATSQQPTFDA